MKARKWKEEAVRRLLLQSNLVIWDWTEMVAERMETSGWLSEVFRRTIGPHPVIN